MNAILFLLPPFMACIVLTGIHTYLGMHVIRREVIFVDIALAQIAALGVTCAVLFNLPVESEMTYFFTLGFTFLGAFFFAYFRNDRLPQEAIIGVSFAVSSALAILIASTLPHGSEHLQHILAGNILWVSWPQIIKTAIIYSLLGIIHFVFRQQFLLVSTDPLAAKRQGLKLWWWDLLFYMSFGLVITSSVQMAGILLVFSFLIVPALCSLLFFEKIRARLLFGWLVGILTSVSGIACSYFFDLPTGPTIVTLFGGLLIICFLVRKVFPIFGSNLGG